MRKHYLNSIDILTLMGLLGAGGLTPAGCTPHAHPMDGDDQAVREAAPPETHSVPDSLAGKELPSVKDLLTDQHVVGDLIEDSEAAVALGKALFWDMQAGSDGQACASCHFAAGADSRAPNQLSPGILGGNGKFDPTRSGGLGPNWTLVKEDFPFHVKKSATDRDSKVMFDTDDVASSQGVVLASFDAVTPGELYDQCTVVPDPPFRVNGTNVRRVEPRNTPTVLNAVYNFRNFWDGRANHIFNGVSVFGPRDPNAFILENQGGAIVQRTLRLTNSSLASQAVGPLLSDAEMSCAGRSFPDVARKLLSEATRPLAFQEVHPDDSVLGAMREPSTGKGLAATYSYAALIREAFADKLWDSDARFDAAKNLLSDPNTVSESEQFSLMESNFALFWGLALQAYESTLITDQSPFDRYRDGDSSALGEKEKLGLDVFMNQGKCVNCHGTAMFTNASSLHLLSEDEEGGLVERMLMSEEHLHYRVAINSFVALTAGGGGKKAGTYRLRLDVEGTPTSASDAIIPGVASGTISLENVSAKSNCVYTPKTMTFGADASPGRDALITADRKSGSNCWPQLRISIEDDVQYAENSFLDRIRLTDAGGIPLLAVETAAEQVEIRQPALYDNGFYNIGVRPTKEDLGVGGTDPFGNPLSFTEQYVKMLLGEDVPDDFHVNPCRFEVPFNAVLDKVLFPGGFSDQSDCDGALSFLTGHPADNAANRRFIQQLRAATEGAFKVPTLRNVELTAPYMHTGGMKSLAEVVEFYNRGGNFHRNPQLDSDITRLNLTKDQQANLVLFLRSLTDPRVVYETAPFDHPQLFVPHALANVADVDGDGRADENVFEDFLEISAVGKDGRAAPISTFLDLVTFD